MTRVLNHFLYKFLSLTLVLFCVSVALAQENTEKKKSIGGAEHETNIYGVEIGMDVPTALKAVFINAERNPGQEKPDALRKEGKSKKDIRVLYKDLPMGELQILFAQGKFVKEILLIYKKQPITDDLRLPFSASIGSNAGTIFSTSANDKSGGTPGIIDENTSIEEFGSSKRGDIDRFSARKIGNIDRNRGDLLDGTRYDDRYTIGFVDNQRLQRVWWRDEKTELDYQIRVAFVGKKLTQAGARFVPSIVQKTISVSPKDEKKFIKAMFK